jgi:hypothetical protein
MGESRISLILENPSYLKSLKRGKPFLYAQVPTIPQLKRLDPSGFSEAHGSFTHSASTYLLTLASVGLWGRISPIKALTLPPQWKQIWYTRGACNLRSWLGI